MENTLELETKTFTIRLPKEIDEALQKQAQAEKRSKNSQIVFILEEYAKRNERLSEISLNK